MTTRVYLIRHGATASNLEVPYRLQGRATDLPLGEQGRDQVRRAAEALSRIPLVAVYASPLRRALETAAAIAHPHGLEPMILPDLIEADLGRWEGLTWDEAREQDPELYSRFHANPGTVSYPDGESFLDVSRRASPAIAGLAARHDGGRIAVVGHNVLNRAYLAPVIGYPIDRARSIRQANGGINVIRYDDGIPELETLNATLHLE